MPATIGSILTAAANEWEKWGRSTWNVITGQKQIAHTDDENDFAQYVIDNYCSVGGGNPSLGRGQGRADQPAESALAQLRARIGKTLAAGAGVAASPGAAPSPREASSQGEAPNH